MNPERVLLDSFRGIYPEPTGNRMVDLALSAFAGRQVADYVGEIDPVSPECAWAHAVLAGLPMPGLDLEPVGYELTHAVFYATDFGRRPIDSPEGRARVLSLAEAETDPDLLTEYAVCMVALGGEPTEAMLASTLEPVSEHHANAIDLLRAVS